MLSRGPARLARSTGAAGGALVFVLGAWGALAPLVGPYFGYGFGSHATWHYSSQRLWLDLIPGAVAMLAGILMLAASTRRAGLLAGWLGLAAGAWFVVGPAVSLTWHHAASPIGRPLGGDVRAAFELIGCFYGLGALIVALVAFASGRFASRPALAPAVDGFAATEPPVVASTPAAGAVASEPSTVVQQPAPSASPATAQYQTMAAAPRRRRSAFGRRHRSTIG